MVSLGVEPLFDGFETLLRSGRGHLGPLREILNGGRAAAREEAAASQDGFGEGQRDSGFRSYEQLNQIAFHDRARAD